MNWILEGPLSTYFGRQSDRDKVVLIPLLADKGNLTSVTWYFEYFFRRQLVILNAVRLG